MPDDQDGLHDLARRLEHLFANIPDPDTGRTYTNDRAAEHISQSGLPITGAYLAALRTGKRTNPSAKHVAAIADLFDVPVTYFFDGSEAGRIEDQIAMLKAMRRTQVQTLVARSAGVSETGIANLAAILEQLRQLEGLDDGETPR